MPKNKINIIQNLKKNIYIYEYKSFEKNPNRCGLGVKSQGFLGRSYPKFFFG